MESVLSWDRVTNRWMGLYRSASIRICSGTLDAGTRRFLNSELLYRFSRKTIQASVSFGVITMLSVTEWGALAIGVADLLVLSAAGPASNAEDGLVAAWSPDAPSFDSPPAETDLWLERIWTTRSTIPSRIKNPKPPEMIRLVVRSTLDHRSVHPLSFGVWTLMMGSVMALWGSSAPVEGVMDAAAMSPAVTVLSGSEGPPGGSAGDCTGAMGGGCTGAMDGDCRGAMGGDCRGAMGGGCIGAGMSMSNSREGGTKFSGEGGTKALDAEAGSASGA